MDKIRLLNSDDKSLYEPVVNQIPEDRIQSCILFGRLMVRELNTNLKTGIALAAPQVGIRERFFVFSNGQMFLNPCILSPVSDRLKMLPKHFKDPTFPNGEGCLSFPGKTEKIPRWEKIKVSYIDENGFYHVEKRLKGIESHVFQHELDHLNGICIIKTT